MHLRGKGRFSNHFCPSKTQPFMNTVTLGDFGRKLGDRSDNKKKKPLLKTKVLLKNQYKGNSRQKKVLKTVRETSEQSSRDLRIQIKVCVRTRTGESPGIPECTSPINKQE